MKNLFLEHFEQYNKRHCLFTAQDKILLTVSGGVDSMVMLSLFVEGGYNVGVAHCNFSLRGAESDEDEATVKREAENTVSLSTTSVLTQRQRWRKAANLWRWQPVVCAMSGLIRFAKRRVTRLLPWHTIQTTL